MRLHVESTNHTPAGKRLLCILIIIRTAIFRQCTRRHWHEPGLEHEREDSGNEACDLQDQGQRKQTIGVFDGQNYRDVVALGKGAIPDSMVTVLETGALDRIRAVIASADPHACSYPPDAVTLLAPVPRPGKIIHTSCNFRSHLEELTTWQAPEWQEHDWDQFHFEHPTGFLEAPSCVVGSGEPVTLRPSRGNWITRSRSASSSAARRCASAVEDALDYVAGLTIFNDLSARDIQAREHANNVILHGQELRRILPARTVARHAGRNRRHQRSRNEALPQR